MVDVYLDLNANFLKMTVRDTVMFICFVVFRCNGTSVIAEIRRSIFSDIEYFKKYFDGCKKNLWVFLIAASMKIWNIKRSYVGVCTDQRFQSHINKSQDIDWDSMVDDLLELCKPFQNFNNRNKMSKTRLDTICANIIHRLSKDKTDSEPKKTKFAGAGPLCGLQFLQLAAMLGIIPLYCATYGDVPDNALGPGKFIQMAKGENLSSSECMKEFKKLHKHCVGIWSGLITPALLENTLCELHRSYKKTITNMKSKKKKGQLVGKISNSVDVICNRKFMSESKVVDIFFENEIRKCVQNLFLVRLSGKGISELRPYLSMKVSHLSKGQNVTINLTNWCQNKNDKMHLKWSDAPNKLTAESSLVMSSELTEILKYHDEQLL